MFFRKYSKYRRMKRRGADAAAVAKALQDDGVGFVEAIRIVRELYDLDLVQGKEAVVVGFGDAASHSEYQEKLLPAVEERLREQESAQHHDAD